MMRTRIKICGVRDAETALVAAECGADAVGLVFVAGSPRHVGLGAAWEIVECLPPFVASVGLFKDVGVDGYLDARAECPFTTGQLHGNEDEATVSACGPDLIKAIRFDPATIDEELRRWSRVAELDAVLVDGGPGGTGEMVDWDQLAAAAGSCDHPIILAGGLTPENVGEAIRVVRPWAVDVSSGVERERGVKDAGLIRAFCEAVRDADLGAASEA